jgi:hypothetical protein
MILVPNLTMRSSKLSNCNISWMKEESSPITRIRRVDERCPNLTSAALALVADDGAIVFVEVLL